ncbi:MAG: hypothetical protein EXR72_00990 [Myxococcales bacterium]|nr:hypothetical protein [Myxococcales bacterium]
MSGRLCALLVAAGVAAGTSGCVGSTYYTPQVVARGELTLRYDGGYEMVAGGRTVARSLPWRGLAEHVRCVPEAALQAREASHSGRSAIALSVIGALFAGAGIAVGATGAIVEYGVRPPETEARASSLLPWLGAGVGSLLVGALFAGLGRLHRNRANGHAVDAMNYYNDAVGSLGATCGDLAYPAPAGSAEQPAPAGQQTQ